MKSLNYMVIIFTCFLLLPSLLTTELTAQESFSVGKIYQGKGKLVKNATLTISKEGKITAITSSTKVSEASAKKVITPGFIDISTSLGLTEIWAVERSNNTGPGNLDRKSDLIQPGYKAAEGFNPNAIAIPLTRSGGVTSVLIQPEGRIIHGQSAWVDLTPHANWQSQIIDSSVAINLAFNSSSAKLADGSKASVMLLLKEAFDDTKYFLKNPKSLDDTRGKQSALSRQDVLALKEGLSGTIPLIFEVSQAIDIRSAISLSKTYKFRLIISGGEEAWMVAQELAENSVPVILNPYTNLPSNFDKLGTRSDNAVLLQKAGVQIILSTFDAHNVRNLRFAAGNAVRAGLPYLVAMSAITSTPASLFKVKNKGEVEKGKLGSFVVWSGDPFEPSSFVEAMYINGKRVSLRNRQEDLFKKYRTIKRRGEPQKKKVLNEK